MQSQYTPDPLLEPLRRHLTQPQWQNLLALVLAVQLARTLVLRQLALFLLCSVFSASCYRRLARLLAWEDPSDAASPPCQHPFDFQSLHRLWVRAVVAAFAPGRGTLVLLIDWTLHRDRCRSLWVMLPVGGRAVPLAFWLAGATVGGKGSQRQLEDRALTQLASWLGKRRRVVLIGDRGFRGADRMRFLKQLGWHFVLRVTGDTLVQLTAEQPWQTLSALQPSLGERWQQANVGYGRRDGKVRARVNLVALRAGLPTPKRHRTNKGKPTGQLIEETTWFLATDLPLVTDAVALYALRMQIEQSFRDTKSLFGMEHEQTKRPERRLRVLLWAIMIGMALDLRRATPQPQAPVRLPRTRPSDPVVLPEAKPRYRAESATREGLHALLIEVVLGASPLRETLLAMQRKSERLQQRPQVRDRRRATPALRNRSRTRHVTLQHG
jgi:Transposase DDE domain